TVLHDVFFFFSSRRRHTRSKRDWSSDVCSSDLTSVGYKPAEYYDGNNQCFVFQFAAGKFYKVFTYCGCQTNCCGPACEQNDDTQQNNTDITKQTFCDSYQQCCLIQTLIVSQCACCSAQVCQTAVDN